MMRTLNAVLAGVLAFGSALEAATIVQPPEGLPSDLGAGEVPLTLVFKGINAAQRLNLEADANLLDNLVVYLKSVDSTRVPDTQEEALAPMTFYIVSAGDPSWDGPAADNTSTLTMSVTLKESVDGALAEKFADKDMTIEIGLDDSAENGIVDPPTSFTLKRDIYVLTEAPEFQAAQAIVGSHSQIRVYWTHKASATAKGSATAKTPKRTHIYVVERRTEANPDAPATLTLPAKKFDATNGTTADSVTCTYTAPAENSGACLTCGAADSDIYLDQAAVTAQIADGTLSAVRVGKALSTDESTTITGLDNDKSYFVFMQWDTGLVTSQCVAGQPSLNITYTELMGEDPASVVDFRCFIATAAYGTPLHRDVRLFRAFRDDVLMKSWPGRLLVEAYYALSPTLADAIQKRPALKSWVRARLETVAGLLRSQDEQL